MSSEHNHAHDHTEPAPEAPALDGHSHAHAAAGRLRIVLLLTASYTVVALVAGMASGSLALVAEAGHSLTDVAGLGMALLAIAFAARPATPQKTYGYYRLEIVAACFNGLMLFAIAGYVLLQAVRRLDSPPDVPGLPLIAVACLGLAVNFASAWLLLRGQRFSLNLRSAFLEVVSDFIGALMVLIAGAVLLLTDFRRIDAVASLLVGAFILPRTWRLLADGLHVLLEGTPRHVDVSHIRDHILGVDGVQSVHDLHVWSLTSGVDVISAHVVVAEGAPQQRVLDDLNVCLSQHFAIAHTTFQVESPDRLASERLAH